MLEDMGEDFSTYSPQEDLFSVGSLTLLRFFWADSAISTEIIWWSGRNDPRIHRPRPLLHPPARGTGQDHERNSNEHDKGRAVDP